MHTNLDVLALLAVGEWTGSRDERVHVEECLDCQHELAELAHTVDLGRHVQPAPLQRPGPQVWDRICAELGLSTLVADRPTDTAVLNGSRPLELALSGHSVVAQADLEPLPTWPTSSGWASVEVDQHGHRQLEIVMQGPQITDALTEAWLIKPDLSGMVPLGLISGSSSRFNVPFLIDLTEYSLVDVSREPLDGAVAHSGDSILRGRLS